MEWWTSTGVLLGDLTFGLGNLGLELWPSPVGLLFVCLLSFNLLGCLGCRLCTSLLYLGRGSGNFLTDPL